MLGRVGRCVVPVRRSSVAFVIPTQACDRPSQTPDLPRVRLRAEVFDALMARRGITSVVAQAAALGTNRSTLFRLRAGETTPLLDLAMDMARLAGTSVEALFELVTES